MKINFRQGIVSYQPGGSPGSPAFLQRVGDNVSLLTTNKPFTVTIAHRDSDYLHSEDVTINNAWSGSFSTGDHWLYLDFNLLTFARTFGVTTVEPVAQIEEPSSPTTGLMWYNTSTNRHFVYNGATWSEVLRVIAAQISNGTFISPSINGGSNYAGTQVGNTNTVFAGRILFDESSQPIQRDNGTFFTTEDAFFTNQSRVDALRLESNVARAQTSGGSLAAFKVVAWTDDGKISSATYDDVGNTVVGILTEDVVPTAPGTPPENAGSPAVTSTNDRSVGAVIIQGVVTNPAWNWTATVDVGSSLWVDNTGSLVTTDPHVSDPLTNTTKRVPVARVLASDTIIFEQGLGGVGPVGPRGPSATATAATTSTLGSVALSTASATPSAPVVVETTDPRLSDARVPLTHNHNAENILLTPTGNIISTDVQTAFAEVDAEKVAKAGDTMTGFLTLSADPTANLHAATKQYVDTEIAGVTGLTGSLNDLDDVIIGGSPAVDEVLTFNGSYWVSRPTSSLGAFTLDSDENLFAGTNAGASLVGGVTLHNILAGENAGQYLDVGDGNILLGRHAGRGFSGTGISGGQNVIIGYNASQGLSSGSSNVIVGQVAGSVTSGGNNTILGAGAGSAITTGSSNVCIGTNTGPTTNQSSQLFINNALSDTPLIWGSFTSNQVTINGTLQATTAIEARDQAPIRAYEDVANGTNYIALQAPANVSTNRTWTLPDDDPSALGGSPHGAYFLTTNAAGELSFAEPPAGGGGGGGPTILATPESLSNFDSSTGWVTVTSATAAGAGATAVIVRIETRIIQSGSASSIASTLYLDSGTGGGSASTQTKAMEIITRSQDGSSVTNLLATGNGEFTVPVNGAGQFQWQHDGVGVTWFTSIQLIGYYT